MRQLTATAGLAFVLVTACIDTAEPPELTLTEELTATLRGDSVLLHNGSTSGDAASRETGTGRDHALIHANADRGFTATDRVRMALIQPSTPQ